MKKIKPILKISESQTSKGIFKRINPKGFENAIILDCENPKTTFNDVIKSINQAIDEKRPIIIESIDLLLVV